MNSIIMKYVIKIRIKSENDFNIINFIQSIDICDLSCLFNNICSCYIDIKMYINQYLNNKIR